MSSNSEVSELDYQVNDDDLQKIDEILMQSSSSQKKLKTSNGGEKKVSSSSSSSSASYAPKQKRSGQNRKEDDRLAQKAQAEKEVIAVKSLLERYHRRDMKAVANKEPALTKVKHIDEVLEKLSKV